MESDKPNSVDYVTLKANSKHLQIRAAQVKQLYSGGLSAFIGAVVGAIVLTVSLWSVIPQFRLIWWLAGYILVSLPRQILIISYQKSNPPVDHVIWWEKWFVVLTIAAAVFWGLASVFLFSAHSMPHQFLLAIFVTGISSGGALAYWPVTFCYMPVILVELLPLSGRFIYQGDQVDVVIGGIIAYFAVVLIMMGRHMHSMNSETLESKFEISNLADSLRKGRDELELRVEERTEELTKLSRRLLDEITERKKTENEMRQSEQFLRQSEKIARTGGWKANPFTDRLYWTEGVYDIYEAPKDYQPGLDESLEFYTPPYRPVLKEAIANTIEYGEPFAIEAEVITTAGKRLWTEVRGLMRVEEGEEPHVVGSFQDITDRKMAESDRKRLSIAIEQVAEAVIITDPDGIIQYVNPAQENLSGYSRDELIGQTPNIFKSDNFDETFYRNLWETIKSGKVWSGRFINKRKDGTDYHEDASISPVFDKSGNLTNFVVVQHDVTEQLALQEQLFQAQKMEAVGALAGGFAHDFNNKLQVIAGYVELMSYDKDIPENLKHDLGMIKQTVDSSAELIKGMMVFSRKTPIDLQPIELNKLVVQTRSMLTQSIPKMIEIELLLADDLWPIKAAPNQIDQILMNLAINASDAMPNGGKLTIKTQNITLDAEYCRFDPLTKPGRYTLITVSDTGAGMDKETLAHIFEPFFTTKDPGKGTGLGLAVVYGIVEQHGGRIICDSEPSVGTTFRIYFPAIEEVPQEKLSEKKKPLRGRGETILVIDDEANIIEVTSRMLNQSNYRVITALNGEDALELYEKHGQGISLVILDFMMPGMGGRGCLRALLTMDLKVRVLVASGGLKEGMAKDLIAEGAKGVIRKPFDIAKLMEQIRKILDEE